MPLTRADPATRTLAVNAETLTVRSVISTIDPDRSGDVVIPTGIQNAEDYLLNPVGLWTITHTWRRAMNASGSGAVRIDDMLIYALYVGGHVLRVRVSADDWERLSLPIGARVNVVLSGQEEAPFFLRATTRDDEGWEWVELSPAPRLAERVPPPDRPPTVTETGQASAAVQFGLGLRPRSS
jgi:hypothetical protein